MSLRFEVSCLEKSVRSSDGKLGLNESALVLLGEFIETIETKITVHGFHQSGKGESKLIIEYYEPYSADTKFGEYYERAKLFASNYCKCLGLIN